MSSFHGSFLFPSVSLSPSDLRGGGAVHCPKLLKLSRDILRSVDATKCDGAELLGLYSRNKMLYDFVQSFEMFQPGIEPMTSCFKLLPFTSTPLRRMHIWIQSGCV